MYLCIHKIINTTMNNYIVRCICLLITLLIMSCSNSNDNPLNEMEQIKEIGNENPQQGLAMLDSIEIRIRNESEYVKHKYDLLRIRLNDKANNIPISDIMIKQLMAYFEEKGSVAEKQEVYYYAGSTYRDLQDTPRALENFFKSLTLPSTIRRSATPSYCGTPIPISTTFSIRYRIIQMLRAWD